MGNAPGRKKERWGVVGLQGRLPNFEFDPIIFEFGPTAFPINFGLVGHWPRMGYGWVEVMMRIVVKPFDITVNKAVENVVETVQLWKM
jgi:hypothetical protein